MVLEHRELTEDEKLLIVSFKDEIDKKLTQTFEAALKGDFTKAGECIAELTIFFFVLGKDMG